MSELTACQHLCITSFEIRNTNQVLRICTDCGEHLTAEQARASFVHTGDARDLLGESICDALGINPRRISSLNLDIQAGFPPVLTVERLVLGSDIEPLNSVFERYQLTPIVPAQQVDDQDSTGTN